MQKPSCNSQDLVSGVLKGELRSVSRLLTWIEARRPEAREALKALYPYTGKARLLGVTGPAGVGKSTLINRLIRGFRKKKKSVGVLALDPSSPFTGGSVLGDRLRMHQHFLDEGVFIRSLVSAGRRSEMWGGISPCLFDAIHVLDAMGKEVIIVETLGVGQDEVQIAHLAETVLLVLAPGIGDEIQALKAGLLEIGDLIAINKADLSAAAILAHALEPLAPARPMLQVSADTGKGMGPLVSTLMKKMKANASNRTKKKQFLREMLRALLHEKMWALEDRVDFDEKTLDAVLRREKDPYTLIEAWPDRVD